MIHDLQVAQVAAARARRPCRSSARSPPTDAKLLAAMGSGNNVPGNIFTIDGNAAALPEPERPLPRQGRPTSCRSSSAWARTTRSSSRDAHNYWEFNYTTNWVHPLYELPFTGGFPTTTYQNGQISVRTRSRSFPAAARAITTAASERAVDVRRQPRPAARPRQVRRRGRRAARVPRSASSRAASRTRPCSTSSSGWPRSSPSEHDLDAAPARRLQGRDRARRSQRRRHHLGRRGRRRHAERQLSARRQRPDLRILPPRSYDRFAVTREINDGLLAPRFAPSTRGWVLSGTATTGFGVIAASQGRDSDDR